MTDMASDIDVRLSDRQKEAARRLICANAQGATLDEQVADATELMMILGVHPSQAGEMDFLLDVIAPLNTADARR